MEKLESKMNEIIKVRKEQDKVILLRTNVPQLYGKLLKKETDVYLDKLFKARVNLPEINMNLPDLSNMNTKIYQNKPDTPFENIANIADTVLKCFSYKSGTE